MVSDQSHSLSPFVYLLVVFASHPPATRYDSVFRSGDEPEVHEA